MPRKPALSSRLAFRLPDDVAVDWRKRASDAGLSLSDWLRVQVDETQATGVAPPGRRPSRRSFVAADPALLRQFAAIGSNLNQIARQVNSLGRGFGGIDQIKAEWLIELDGMRGELRELRDIIESDPQRGGGSDAH